MSTRQDFLDHFDAPELDTSVWVPHYLPHWSSRAESAATFTLGDSELSLTIPTEQGLWCAGDHEPPLRVSGIQSGVFAGAAGSTVGQLPFREGLRVREEQPTQWGWTPEYGRLEVRARMELSPRSMASVWMAGLEQEPERSGEICIFEIFGEALRDGADGPRAEVGMGIKPFRDPALVWDFEAPGLALDVAQHHVYAAEWRPGGVDFLVDGECVRTAARAPAYALQMMVGLFDFPDKASLCEDPDHVPSFCLDYVRGEPLS
jgi:hypothetical protein